MISVMKQQKVKLNSNYWEERYQNNETDWNVGTITTPIKTYIDQLEDKALRILIPGAGNGYELEYLIGNGFENSFVVDFAATPLKNIQNRMPNLSERHLIHANFFELNGQFDLIIEQTFFCAIAPELRMAYVQKMKSLLKPQGKIAGLLFQFPLTEAGPPFGSSSEEYQKLFEEDFNIKTLTTAYNSIQPREEKELFFIFEKK